MTRRAAALAAALALAASAALAVLFASAGGDGGQYVFPPGSSFGARLEPCPVSDCAPVFHAAEAWLDREQPGHPAVVRERLGTLACSRDPHEICIVSPPIGMKAGFEVVLDLAGRPDPVLVGVICWESPENGGEEWNGGWCSGFG
jgi:hypothetical protein